MEKHDPTQVVVLNSWGSISVFPCHVDVAYAIFTERVELYKESQGNLFPSDMLTLFEQPILHLTRQTMERAFRECMGESTMHGTEMVTLRRLCFGSLGEGKDTRPSMQWSMNVKKELLHWCVDHNFEDWKQAYQECTIEDLRELSWFKIFEARRADAYPGKGIELVDGFYYEKYQEFKILEANRWKDKAKPASVVQRYLAFINENFCHRDERYELGTLELEYSKYLQQAPSGTEDAPSI